MKLIFSFDTSVATRSGHSGHSFAGHSGHTYISDPYLITVWHENLTVIKFHGLSELLN